MFNKLVIGSRAANYIAKTCSDKSTMLVLIKLMYSINRMNIVVGTPKSISASSGITIGDFSSGVRGLKKLDFVRKYTKREYMLNPEVVFNGDDRQFYIVKHMWDTQTSRGLRT